MRLFKRTKQVQELGDTETPQREPSAWALEVWDEIKALPAQITVSGQLYDILMTLKRRGDLGVIEYAEFMVYTSVVHSLERSRLESRGCLTPEAISDVLVTMEWLSIIRKEKEEE